MNAAVTPAIVADLERMLGAGNVRTDAGACHFYSRDLASA